MRGEQIVIHPDDIGTRHDTGRNEMKLVLISDTHGQNNLLEGLPSADVIIHCGDVTRYGNRDGLREFAKAFSQCKATHKIAIAGNHDACFEKHSIESNAIMARENIIYLENDGITLDGVKFWGMPWTPVYGIWSFMADEDLLMEKWARVPKDTDIIISHGPPRNILDETVDGDRVGSFEHRFAVSHIRPRLNVFGHIHEAYGMQHFVGVDYINCSILNEKYVATNEPVVYELK
jgi:Icc-related predicted phosphoesterase